MRRRTQHVAGANVGGDHSRPAVPAWPPFRRFLAHANDVSSHSHPPAWRPRHPNGRYPERHQPSHHLRLRVHGAVHASCRSYPRLPSVHISHTAVHKLQGKTVSAILGADLIRGSDRAFLYVLASRVTTAAGFVTLQPYPSNILAYALDPQLYGFMAKISRLHNRTMIALGVDSLDTLPPALPAVPAHLVP